MTGQTTTTLSDVIEQSGVDVLAHLDRQVVVPIIAGLQAQGDLIVIPRRMLPHVHVFPTSQTVDRRGLELLRNESGGNPHSLVASGDGCRWNTAIRDPEGLAIGVIDTDVVAYLIHPEHGASGIAPGTYVIRRQRERGGRFDRLIAD